MRYSYIKMGTTVLFLIIFVNSNLLISTIASSEIKKFCPVGTAMSVYVVNALPGPMNARCQSGNKDLGNRTIAVNNELSWDFCANAFGRTLWFCHLYWGSKDKSFDVYNSELGDNFCANNECYWTARPDGIYIYKEKLYEWDGNKEPTL